MKTFSSWVTIELAKNNPPLFCKDLENVLEVNVTVSQQHADLGPVLLVLITGETLLTSNKGIMNRSLVGDAVSVMVKVAGQQAASI